MAKKKIVSLEGAVKTDAGLSYKGIIMEPVVENVKVVSVLSPLKVTTTARPTPSPKRSGHTVSATLPLMSVLKWTRPARSRSTRSRHPSALPAVARPIETKKRRGLSPPFFVYTVCFD